MSMRNINNTRHNQQGFASMVVALTLVIVLALVTIGFAQLTRREQQNALNKQLATQANYAAESGINDAIKYLHENPGYDPDPTECLSDLPTTATSAGYKPAIDTTNGVSYTCMLIDTKPKSLQFTQVDPRSSELVTFNTTDAPDPLTIEWDSLQPNAPNDTSGGFPTTGSWTASKYPAVLQFSITSLGNGSVDRASLTGSTFTAYLYPTNSATVPEKPYNPATQGLIIPASCVPQNGGRHCEAKITGLATGGYLLHILNLYDRTDTITITGGNDPNLVNFIDGQAVIDVTGKARDVLKRLRVRVCLSVNNCQSPLPGTEGQNICKRLETRPGNTDFKAISGSITGGNNPCYLSD